MKWTPKNIALVAAVVLVWGYMGYRGYQYFFGSSEDVLDEEIAGSVTEQQITQATKKVYMLSREKYRDPFLDRTFTQRTYQPVQSNPGGTGTNTRNNRNNRKNQPDKEVKKEPVKWPEIFYKGIIQNPAKGSKVALVSINGLDQFYLENETLNGIKMIKIYTDSARIEYMGEYKTFVK